MLRHCVDGYDPIKDWITLFVLTLLIGLWGGECFADPSANTTTAGSAGYISQNTAQKHKVRVILDWFINADHAPLLAAQYGHIFAKHGLDVELIAPADPGTPARLLAAGQADLAISYHSQLAFLVEKNIPLVRVGSLVDAPLNCLITGPEITEPKQLKGKKIGVSTTGVDNVFLQTMLNQAGLSLNDITIVNVGFQLEQALMTHSVDAIMGAVRTYELLDLQQRQFHPHAFYPEQMGVPLYEELIFIASREHAHDPVLKEFMEALREGTNILINHLDEIFEKTIQDHPELNTPLNKAAWSATLPFFAKHPAMLDTVLYQHFMDFMQKNDILHHSVHLSDYAIDPTLSVLH